jgi:hypothetical protein
MQPCIIGRAAIFELSDVTAHVHHYLSSLCSLAVDVHFVDLTIPKPRSKHNQTINKSLTSTLQYAVQGPSSGITKPNEALRLQMSLPFFRT